MDILGSIADAARERLRKLSEEGVQNIIGAINPTAASPAASERVGSNATGQPVVQTAQAQPGTEWPSWVKPVGIGLAVALVAGIAWKAVGSN